MIKRDELGPRIGVPPWRLYRSDALAALRKNPDERGFYLGMLKDDLKNRRYAYDLRLEPTGATAANAGAVVLHLLDDFDRAGYGDDPAALVCDVASYLLEESLSSDCMLMELHMKDRDEDAGPARRRRRRGDGQPAQLPSLGFIPFWSVADTALGLRQVSPEVGQVEAVIPAQRVLRLKMNDHGRKALRTAVRRLHVVDEVKTVGADMSRLAWRGYDFSSQVKAQELAVAAATVTIGWDGRGAFGTWATSPYITYRELRFVRFWVEAVADVIEFLNGVTGSPALYGEGRFNFTLAGLPSVADLERAMHDVRVGALTVGEAHSRFLSPKYSKRRQADAD